MKKYIFIFVIYHTFLLSNSRVYHNYFWANYNYFSGNKSQTHYWYNQIFNTTSSFYTYKGYLNFLATTNQWKQIISLLPSLNEKFATDPAIQLIFVQALEATNRLQESDEKVIRLSHSFIQHPEISLRSAQAYLRRKEPENALLTVNSFLNSTVRRPHNFIFYFLLSHIYVELNNPTLALENVQKCLNMHPQFDKGWLLYASLHEKEGKLKEAVSGYNNFLALSGKNSAIEQHLISLMLKSQQAKFSIVKQKNIDKALFLFNQKKYTQALHAINTSLVEEPSNKEYKLLKIQILSSMKKYDETLDILKSWILESPHDPMWYKTLYLLTYNGISIQKCKNVFQAILKDNQKNLMANVYCADLCIRNNNMDVAITYLNNALQCAIDNNLAAHISYQLSLLYYEQNNYHAMLQALEKAYTFNSACPHINNALAYYWAKKGNDYSKAHNFVEKSLSLDEKNPYFLDTKAFILYKEKKYQEAQDILEHLKDYPNGTILLHLAKVHYKLKDTAIAHTLTREAQAVIKSSQEKKSLKKMQLLLAHE